MSVEKTKRHDGELIHIAKTREAAEYVIHITNNEKLFPKKARYTTVNKLQNIALDLVVLTVEAEEILPASISEYELKHLKLEEAQGKCRGLLALLDLCATEYGLSPNRMEYATKLITDARIKILNRMKKDESKYKRVYSTTPNASNSNNARNVNSDGTLNNNNAYNGNNGVRPAHVDNET